LLDNTKHNLDRVYDVFSTLLKEEEGVAEVIYVRKPSMARGMEPANLEKIRGADFVICGLGD
jgi:hypothetical protein